MSTPEHRIESLLLHDGFVRALSRSLLSDPHAAEDVAQETWVAALEGGAEAASLSRWITGVVKNLAGKTRRGEHRRQRREHESARPEATPSGEEILEREAARARVVAAVLALEEPYRECVLLRYFENLPPRALAQRLALPVETVRTRLKRALEMLRARLDREFGERGTWGLALAPFARPSSASLTRPSALAMTLHTSLAVAALAVVGLYFALRPREEPAPTSASPTGTSASASVAAVAPPPPTNAEPAVPPSRVAVSAPPVASPPAFTRAFGGLRVHATWSDGTPAAGIHARVEAAELESPAFHALEAVTDEGGAFALAAVPCGTNWVTLDRDCGAKVTIEAGSEATLALEIPRGFDVEGLVVGHERAPVADAELWLSDMNTITGAVVGRSRADGSFRLRSVASGHSLGARAAGHAPSLLSQLRGDDGATVPARLVLLGAGGELGGRVLGPDGAPVAGATVLVGGDGLGFRRVFVPGGGELTGTGAPPAVARTDEAGRYALAGLDAGRTFVAVRAEGLARWRGEVAVSAGERATLDASLLAEARLTGRVLDGSGAPVALAHVQLQNAFGRLDPSCTTAADGAFCLAGLAPGPLRVVASAREKGNASTTLTAQAGDELTWDAVVGLGLVLRGRVLDAGGGALARWRVELQDELQLDPPDHGSARTDAEGRFTIVGLHERPHRVMLRAPGEAGTFASTVLGGIRPTADEQLFRVADKDVPSVHVRGLVADELGNVPAPLELELQSLDLGLSREMPVDEQGRFALGPFAPGSYVLRVRAQGRPEHVLGPRRLAAGESWDCGAITVRAAGVLVVRVPRAPGTESLQPWFRILQGSFDRMKLEPAGELWRCDALAPGSMRLKMSGGGVAAALVPFEIRAGETTELELPLRPGLHREIRVTLGSDPGARRPRIRLTNAAGELVVDEDMWARLPGEFQEQSWFAPGTYRVELELEGGPRAEAELVVAAGVPEAEPLVLTLP